VGKSLLASLRHSAGSLRNRTPVPYVSGRNISIPWRQPTGAEAQMRAMGTVGTLFAIVNRTSNATALVNWHLYRKAASGLKEDRVEVTSHAVLDLWNRPNPFFTRQELVESGQQHVDLVGEGWLVIARNARSPLPLELWLVRPDRIQPVPHPTDFISGYMYTGPDGQEIALRVEDVIQIRMPNPMDPYRGMGPVQSILTEIDASRYAAEWNRNFFLNSAEPGGIIQVPNRLSDAEFDELSTRWNEQHKGVANAHRVAIIEQGEWVDRKLTQRDMQFAELRSVSRDVIREAFGAPAFVLGEVGDVNRATAEAAKVLFAEQLTVPRLERWKGALNNDLLPLFGKDAARTLEFDYEDPVPPDAEARNAEIATKTTAWVALVEAGADASLAAEYLGLPDLGYTPPITVQAPPAPAAVPAPAARLDLHHHVPLQLPAPSHAMYNAARTMPRPIPVWNAAEGSALEQVREQFNDAMEQLLTAWDDVADAQYDQLETQIEQAVNDGDSAALAALTVDSEDAVTVLQTALGDMATTAAEQMAAEAGEQGVTVRPPKVDKRLLNVFGGELVDIAVATAGLLSTDMAASAGREALRLFTPGADGAGVAGQVVGFLKGLKNWLRRDQLGAALHRAQNIGRLATLAAAPPATYVADERLDSNTCLPCREIDGTEWDTLAEAQAVYGAGGYSACEGGSRCRGTVTARWD
jgi:HK97 family phage portal protein